VKALLGKTKKPKKASTSEAKVCRNERERAVWTALYGFVNARPERYQQDCGECCLTAAQSSLLRIMNPDTPVPMSALATALACHASNVTGLVDGLEEYGLVTRQPSESDRRVKKIALTKKGIEAREVLRGEIFAPPPELSRLNEEELGQLEALLRRIDVTAKAAT
jgi:DNA-binding MarR family transcriptional regulator